VKPKKTDQDLSPAQKANLKTPTLDLVLYGLAFVLCVLLTLLMLSLSGNALQFDAVYRGF
jgi:hypothetical protein